MMDRGYSAPTAEPSSKKYAVSQAGKRVPSLSIIVPVLDEAPLVAAAVQALASFRERGAEVIVVDGGSRDGTPELARPHADRVMLAPRGRAAQMNAGAEVASGDALLFLHVDTKLPPDADRLVLRSLATAPWGRFDVTIEGRSALLPLVAALMNFRSRLGGIATGDQAIFATREAFRKAGGFPAIALMEDVALSRRLKRIGRPICLAERVTTSGRRWERDGVVRTILTMWGLRLAFSLGADPTALAKRYGYVER
jgi:rSAM/selenodomain-associated transferase 2